MKRLIIVIIGLLMILTGCGSKATSPVVEEEKVITQEDYYGTWVSYKIKEDGSYYTVEELEKLGNDQLKDLYLVIKEGGNAYVYSKALGIEQSRTWQYSNENGFYLEAQELVLEDGDISWDTGTGIIYLKKYSNNQDITMIPTDEVTKEEQIEVEEIIEEEINQNTIRPEIKEAIDTYEEFIDEYCEFMKKYSESDGKDFGLLADYATFMSKYADMANKMDELENDLTDAETLYYSEVMLRCSQKLMTSAS